MNRLEALTPSSSSSSTQRSLVQATIVDTQATRPPSGGVDMFVVAMVILGLMVLVGAAGFTVWGLHRRLRGFRSCRTSEVACPGRNNSSWQHHAQLTGNLIFVPQVTPLTAKAGNPVFVPQAKLDAVLTPIFKPPSGYQKLLGPNEKV